METKRTTMTLFIIVGIVMTTLFVDASPVVNPSPAKDTEETFFAIENKPKNQQQPQADYAMDDYSMYYDDYRYHDRYDGGFGRLFRSLQYTLPELHRDKLRHLQMQTMDTYFRLGYGAAIQELEAKLRALIVPPSSGVDNSRPVSFEPLPYEVLAKRKIDAPEEEAKEDGAAGHEGENIIGGGGIEDGETEEQEAETHNTEKELKPVASQTSPKEANSAIASIEELVPQEPAD